MKMSDFFNLPLKCDDIRHVKFNCKGKNDEKVALLHYAVVHAAENYDRLVEENQKLREALANVLHAESHNTGHEPSLSVFHRSVDEALQLLEELDK